jgi:hydrogenase-1 operon protein HyaF
MTARADAELRTGMASALLSEILATLERLAEEGESGSVDLRSLPLSDADRLELADALGSGEVRASVTCTATTEVSETAFAGVWWVRLLGEDGRVNAEHIEIARVPEILLAHPADIVAASRKLAAALATRREPLDCPSRGDGHA